MLACIGAQCCSTALAVTRAREAKTVCGSLDVVASSEPSSGTSFSLNGLNHRIVVYMVLAMLRVGAAELCCLTLQCQTCTALVGLFTPCLSQ